MPYITKGHGKVTEPTMDVVQPVQSLQNLRDQGKTASHVTYFVEAELVPI